ncbi:AtpZ/AtpI family protein [Desulfobacterota bacterium M19]
MAGDKKEMIRLMTDFGTLGLTMAASVFIGLGFGYYLDHKVFSGRTSPWFTFIFLGFGIIAGFKNIYQMAKRKDF